MSSLPALRLVYFPVRARAECARMILAYGAIPYTDDDCTSFFGCSFQEAKKSGKLPFGQLPVLQVRTISYDINVKLYISNRHEKSRVLIKILS